MPVRALLPFLLAATASFANPFAGAPRLAAFTDVQFPAAGARPVVAIAPGGPTYTLVSLQGLPSTDVLAYCIQNFGDDAYRRFREDLTVVLSLMGKPVASTLRAELTGPSGATATHDLTLDGTKRDHLRRNARNHQDPPVRTPENTLTKRHATRALDSFAGLLAARFAYHDAPGTDIPAAVADAKQNLPDSPTADDLDRAYARVLAASVDGHTSIRTTDGLPQPSTRGILPFLIEPCGDGLFAAFKPDRSAFLTPSHTFITAIDGIPIEQWLRSLTPYVAKGSAQYVTRHTLRLLRDINAARTVRGLPATRTLTLTLDSPDADKSRQVALPVAGRKPIYGSWPRKKNPGILENHIGYLPIDSMDDDAVDLIENNLPRFKKHASGGLVIDVRGNGGGSRDALLALYPHLAKPGSPPLVASAAKFLHAPGISDDHLDRRFMYPADHSRWSSAESRAIASFAKTFSPEWQPPAERFSPWHYLVLSRPKNAPAPYDKPVVVLMDQKCFSATDIFLAALREVPGVTLVGQPSGGGSALSLRHRAPLTRTEFRCASMASFQPSGQLYDTNGVEPHITVTPSPSYFLDNGPDPFLDRAREVLAGSKLEHFKK